MLGLAYFLLFAFFIALLVLFDRASKLKTEVALLRHHLRDLEDWCERVYGWLQADKSSGVQAEAGEPAAPAEAPSAVEVQPRPPELVAQRPVAVPMPEAPQPAVVPPVAPQPVVVTRAEVLPPQRAAALHRVAERPPAAPEPPAVVRPPAAAPPARPAPQPRRDLEVAIGTAWVSRIGMVAVLLAAVFFLVHAYNRGWITPPMIVGLGIVTGLALMVGGELAQRRGYDAQSQVLTGGGAALLYLTLWAGHRRYEIVSGGVTFAAMAAVTIAAAVQAVRHESQTVATFAWIAGYAVPVLIGEGQGTRSAGPAPLFAYLTLLSAAVFFVAQRFTWPAFTGLALLCANVSGVYIFRVSDGSLGWTLTYLMLVTAGMLWVAATRQGRAGESFGAVGAVVGYVVTGITLCAGGKGSPAVPYLYLLGLSGIALWRGHVQGVAALRWIGTLGSFAGFVLMLTVFGRQGFADWGHWLLLYAALCVAGTLAAAAGRHSDAEPLAVSAVVMAYSAAALLAWAAPRGSVSDGAMVAYLGALAAAVLALTGRFDWPTFSRVGLIAAFVATALLAERMPRPGAPGLGAGLTYWSLLYLAMLVPAALSVAAHERDRVLGTLTVAGAFGALPLTGLLGPGVPAMVVPCYLTVAAVVTLVVTEWQRWYGAEWLSWAGTWILYIVWREVTGQGGADPAFLLHASVFAGLFLVADWVRHGVRGTEAAGHDAVLVAMNLLVYGATAYYDLRFDAPRGYLALGLAGVYLAMGIAAARLRPQQGYFGPVLIGLAFALVTGAVHLLAAGWHATALWTLEATVALGFGFYCRSIGLRTGAAAVLLLALVRAVVADSHVSREVYVVLLNSRALALLSLAAAMYLWAYAYQRFEGTASAAEEDWLPGGLVTTATALLLWVASAEVWYGIGWRGSGSPADQHYGLSLVWLAFVGALLGVGAAYDLVACRGTALALLAVTVGKVLFVDPRLTPTTYRLLTNSHTLPLLFAVVALLAAGWWYRRNREVGEEAPDAPLGRALPVLGSLLLWWVLTTEAWHYVGWSLGAPGDPQQYALSAVWTLYGAVLVAIGLATRRASLRWTAMSLLGLTIGKVFFHDLREQGIVFRILALLGLGAVLIGVGFGYQKLVRDQTRHPSGRG